MEIVEIIFEFLHSNQLLKQQLTQDYETIDRKYRGRITELINAIKEKDKIALPKQDLSFEDRCELEKITHLRNEEIDPIFQRIHGNEFPSRGFTTSNIRKMLSQKGINIENKKIVLLLMNDPKFEGKLSKPHASNHGIHHEYYWNLK